MADLVGHRDKEIAAVTIAESLRLGAFNHSVIGDLLVIAKCSSRVGTTSPGGSYSASTGAWSALKAVS